VSWNENGFWQADVYLNTTAEEWDDNSGAPPDGFFTGCKGESETSVIVRAARKWPTADIRSIDIEPDEEIASTTPANVDEAGLREVYARACEEYGYDGDAIW
jgi:hypothetical protein